MLLSSYFDKFIESIQPSDARIKAVAAAHSKLREYLVGNSDLSEPLNDSFLAGSYARHTAIDPIKDVDIILILTRTSLDDDRKLPSPAGLMRDLKQVVDKFYDNVDLVPQRRSLRVELADDDIVMDLVPAIAPIGKDEPLFVPDRSQGCWIDSNPAGHLSNATALNRATEGYYVRVVKALKWWKSRSMPKKHAPKSFLLEALVGAHVQSADTAVQTFIATVSQMVRELEPSYNDDELPVVLDPAVPENDLVESCGWTLDGFKRFFEELQTLEQVAKQARDASTKPETIALWQSVLGSDKDPPHMGYPSSLEEREDGQVAKHVGDELRYEIKLSAMVGGLNGHPDQPYPSDGKKLSKKRELTFKIAFCDVPPPFKINWVVRNHGHEARQARDLARVEPSHEEQQIEHTGYSGHHYLDCEIEKDGVVVARARHVVNVASF